MAKSQDLFIANNTVFPTAATIRQSDEPKGVLLINSGTCIKRSFYSEFATFFATQGYITITYDYIGVGGSRPIDLKGLRRSIYDWGAHDMETMSLWIDEHYPQLPKYIIGHSMGGQIVGLMKSINSFDKIITIASSYGNVRNYNTKLERWKMLLASKTVFPLLNRVYGYFPASKLGLGIDWPFHVAEDWRLWNSDYLSLRQWMERLGKPHYFEELNTSMLSFLLSDDHIATERCIPHFRIDFPEVDLRVIRPEDYELEKLGHFETFKPRSIPFWRDILKALEA